MISPNKGKNLIIEVDGKKYERYPIRTCLITPEHKDLSLIVKEYATPYLKKGDILFIGEKVVAVSQGRSYPKSSVKVSWLAKLLVKFVTKTPIGVGISSPQTMQLALEEVGALRILLAAFFSAMTKPFGIKGVFYMIAGEQARSIDGAADYVIPPYNTYVSKGPKDASLVASDISSKIGHPVAIVDVCDFGAHLMGNSSGIDKGFIEKVLKDNPLCQTNEQTPMGIIRELQEK